MVFGFFTWWPSKGYTLSYRVLFTWFSFHGYFSYSFWYLVASQGYFSYSFWDGFSCDSSKQLTGSFYLVVPSKVKVNIKKQLKYKNKQLKYSREINIKKQIYKSNIMRYKNNIRVFNNYVYNCTFLHFVQTNILVSVGSLDILHLEPHLLHLFSVNIQVGSLAHLANLFL